MRRVFLALRLWIGRYAKGRSGLPAVRTVIVTECMSDLLGGADCPLLRRYRPSTVIPVALEAEVVFAASEVLYHQLPNCVDFATRRACVEIQQRERLPP
jgi:hypothetical protein